MFSLEAKIRTESAKEARQNGAIPAVVYGKDVPSTMVSLGTSEFIKTFRSAGKNHIITLTVDKKTYNVLIQETQRHPVTGTFLHVDFLTVDMKAEVHVKIPVKLVGTSPAVVEGGHLHQSLDAVEVKCLPADMIEAFELDISSLTQMDTTLHVSDIAINAKKYTLLSHKEEAVVSVHAPKDHKTETEAVSVDAVGVATAKEKAE